MQTNKSDQNSIYSGMTEKQKKIFESALETFAEKGFSAASTGEIARKAGVAEGLIFKHFKNKKDLFQKIAFMVVEKTLIPLTVQRLEKFLEDDYTDIKVFLKLFFYERLDFIKKHKSFIRIILQEATINQELLNFAKSQFETRLFPLARKFIERHQQAGLVKPVDPSIILRMTMTSLLGYVILRIVLLPDSPWDDEKEIESTINILCEGISTPPGSGKNNPNI